MIDLALAAFLAFIGMGLGRRILDRLGQVPEHPFDAAALSLPMGLGVVALGVLGLGELGWLNRFGLAGLLAVVMELGLLFALRTIRELGRRVPGRDDADRRGMVTNRIMAGLLAV